MAETMVLWMKQAIELLRWGCRPCCIVVGHCDETSSRETVRPTATTRCDQMLNEKLMIDPSSTIVSKQEWLGGGFSLGSDRRYTRGLPHSQIFLCAKNKNGGG